MADLEPQCLFLPPRSPRSQHILFLRCPVTNTQCVLVQKCPWWQIIHYSWMNEINSLLVSLQQQMALRGKETPNPLYKPLYKQHNGVSWFSHLAWPSLPYFAGSKLPFWEGPTYFVWKCAFYSICKWKFNTTQQIERLLCAGPGELKGCTGLNEGHEGCNQHMRPRL